MTSNEYDTLLHKGTLLRHIRVDGIYMYLGENYMHHPEYNTHNIYAFKQKRLLDNVETQYLIRSFVILK